MQLINDTDRTKEHPVHTPLIPATMMLPFILVTAMFFLWGIPNNLNDILIRQFMKALALTRLQAGFVQSAFYLGYFFLALPAAFLMRRYGYKMGFIAGLLLLGLGTFLFWPAALSGKYWCFLGSLFVLASGLSFLETASNSFITQLGAPEGAVRRLNLAQAFNPLGVICGALIGTVFIFSGVELTPTQIATMEGANTYSAYLHAETMRVVAPYIVIGIVSLLWAIMIALSRFPEMQIDPLAPKATTGSLRELLGARHFLMAIVAQFMYVGASVGTWSYFIQYIQESVHQPEKAAGYYLTGTLALFGVGRFVSAAAMRYISPSTLMCVFSIVNVVLAGIAVTYPGFVGIWAIFTTSFFMSLMYPTIFALGIRGLGEHTKIGGSLLVMAIVGGAVLTPVMGWIAQIFHTVFVSYAVPMLCYCFIAFYAIVERNLAPASPRVTES